MDSATAFNDGCLAMSPTEAGALSALVVTWNSADTILECLGSLPRGMDVIVVDNGSTDDTVARLKGCGLGVRIIEPGRNLGFGAACNLAASHAQGEHLLLLNPDATLEPEALAILLRTLEEQPEIGAIAPYIQALDASPELSWGEEPGILQEWRRQRAQNGIGAVPSPPALASTVAWVSGACLLLRGDAWREVGGFDEGFFLYFEDLDLCKRIRSAGWSIVYEPRARAIHRRGHSSSQIAPQVEAWYRASQLRYYLKHAPRHEQFFLKAYLSLKYLLRAWREPEPARTILQMVWGLSVSR